MAEDTPTNSTPAAGEPVAERAPDTETKPAAAADPAPETSQEKETEKANEPVEKEKPSDNDANAPEEKKESDEAPAEQPSASAEATDAKEPQEGAAAATQPGANGTPASAKKGGNKRKSGGVAEHKSNANRRKSQNRVLQLQAQPGEYYLARLRSFPPWPSVICDEELLPQSLLDTRPVSAMRPDGTVREDYAEGGKRAHERTFPVMFFQTNEFAWIPNICLTPTDAESCKNVSEKGKSKVLLQAYAVAAEGHDLQHFKSLLADHQHALEQEIEEQEAKAAAKAEKDAKKNKRKSMDIADDAEDVEMEDADDAKKTKGATKKRKKDAKADDEAEKPAKTPKTGGTKLKLTTPRTPASEGGKKTAGASKAKQTASSKKGSKAAASDEDEESAGAESKQPEKPLTPEEAKAKKEKEVLYIRHKLQKGFISRDQPPKEEEMTSMASCLTKLEKYDEIEISIIRSTKINKVLKMIIKLNFIPRDEELQFRQRAMGILSKWKTLEPETATPGDDKDKGTPKPGANGVHKEDSVDTPTKAKTEEEKEGEAKQQGKEDTNEPLDDPMTDADAGDKTKAPELVKEVETAVAEDKAAEEKKSEEKTETKTENPEDKEKPAEQKEDGEKAEGKSVEATA